MIRIRYHPKEEFEKRFLIGLDLEIFNMRWRGRIRYSCRRRPNWWLNPSPVAYNGQDVIRIRQRSKKSLKTDSWSD